MISNMISMSQFRTHAYGRGIMLPGCLNETKSSQDQQAW